MTHVATTFPSGSPKAWTALAGAAAFIVGLALAADGASPGVADIGEAVRLFETGKFDEAKTILTAIESKDPGSAGAAFYLGRIATHQKHLDQAVHWLEKAVELEPSSSAHHMWLGDAYASKAQHAGVFAKPFLARSIKKELEKAVELDASNLDARQGLIQFYVIAPGILGGSAQKAEEQAAEITKLDAVRGHQLYAWIYTQEKDFAKAEREYIAAVKADPQKKDPRYALGYFYQGQSKYDEALAVFEELVKLDSSDSPAYYQIGRTGVLSGKNLDRAEECFRTYLEKAAKDANPSPAWAHYRLGMLYQKNGSEDLAKREYEAALALQPDHKEAKKALGKLS